MGAEKKYPVQLDLRDVHKVDGDLGLALWYALLKDYRRRFRKDKLGFIRVPSKVFKYDTGADRMKVWRYNKKLEDKGLVIVDRVARGNRTWIGFKLV